ncbi:MAG: hypothetical protein ABSG31_01830 [Tepidisphaeraceae bacterium]
MRQDERFDQKRCWIDVYETPYFQGTLHRHFGPQKMQTLPGGSAIVGPEAHVELQILRGDRPVTVILKPNRIVPDLAKATRGGSIRQVILHCEAGSQR